MVNRLNSTMNKSEITKLLLLRGASADLTMLDEAEFAYTQDQGRLFVGQTAYGDILARETFPFANLEVLTENSTEVFSGMHGSRIQSSKPEDYYVAKITPSGSNWAPVEIIQDGVTTPYIVNDITNVMITIDYALHEMIGPVVRMGKLQLRHFQHFSNPREPMLEDQSVAQRNPGSYDPRIAFVQTCLFRFRVVHPISAPVMVFEYRSTGTEVLSLRFKVSRPEPQVYIQAPSPPQVYIQTIPSHSPSPPSN